VAKLLAGQKNTRVKAQAAGNAFWDSAPLVNLLADVLFFAGGILLVWAGVLVLQRLPVFPLRQMIVMEPLRQVSRAQIDQAARAAVAGNFFTVDLAAAQAVLEQVPWVRRASLRRQWPDGLALTLEEQQPVARWTPLDGEARLVNTHGEVFVADTADALPVFSGPEGSAAQVLARYHEFAAALGGIQHNPVAVSLSPREAWQLTLDDGVVLELGRDLPQAPLTERLNRFTAHYATVKTRVHTVSVVDMRYPNGFALRLKKS
jgi:cell division protein FtsQ